jgi:hypothetical protein
MAEIRPQLPCRAVEAGGTVRARLHHAALPGRRRELGEFAALKPLGHPQLCVKQTLFHRSSRLCNGFGGLGHGVLVTASAAAGAAHALTLIAD